MFTICNIIISIIPSIIYFIECPRMSLREFLLPRVLSFRLYWTILLFWLVSDDLKYLLEHHIFHKISQYLSHGKVRFFSEPTTNQQLYTKNQPKYLSFGRDFNYVFLYYFIVYSLTSQSIFFFPQLLVTVLLSWSHVVQVYWLEVVQV